MSFSRHFNPTATINIEQLKTETMTTQQLIWIAFGELGVIAFMTFMYGLASAKCHGLENEKVYLKAENADLTSRLRHYSCDIKQLSEIIKDLESKIKELKADLSHEGDLRRETSRQLEQTTKELKKFKPKRDAKGWFISNK